MSDRSVFDSAAPWALRLAWASLPFTAGPVFADALAERASLLQTGTSLALWAVWALALLAMMVPIDKTLTAIRVLVPASIPAVLFAAVNSDASGALIALGTAVAVAATMLSMTAPIGELFINGNSYGDEWRSPLKPPGPVLVAPLPLAWAAAAGGLFIGPLLLLAERWVLGAIISVIGFGLAGLAIRALHVLTQRWAVFVPAGMVIHDGFSLAEPVLFRRREIRMLRAAPQETPVTDLTAGALGLAVEVVLEDPIEVGRPVRGQAPTNERIGGFMFSPTRPGKTIATAKARKIASEL